MIEHEQIPEPAQPVGEHHAAGRDRPDFLAFRSADEYALPDNAALCTWSAEPAG